MHGHDAYGVNPYDVLRTSTEDIELRRRAEHRGKSEGGPNSGRSPLHFKSGTGDYS